MSDDWPTICVPRCPITDDDIQFNSDLAYLKDLRRAIRDIDFNHELPLEFNTNLVWATDQLAGFDRAFTPKSMLSKMLANWKEENGAR